jgi:ribonuclease HI
MKHSFILKFDGSSQPNPGPSGCGYEITLNGDQVEIKGRSIGFATINEAEYLGLIDGFEALKRLGIREAEVYGDSMLVCKQVSGLWKVKAENLKGLWKKAVDLKTELGIVKIEHIPRKENTVADRMAKESVV